ncbi:nucleotide exchange factor GrpE [Alkalibaculum bacchi]|uniref:nucleotide exchange factor GrpE n=1 Tax=Alkalibaculum bacchi TaxID=645887 RepID=UPI0026EFFAAE|nr:nucleotide exchange factor GrpE [Alkalibaculum bacchi]
MDKEEIIRDEIQEEVEETVKNHEDVEEATEKKEETSSTESVSKEKEELLNKLVRLQADFDNFRKRTIKEKEEIYKYALSDFSEKFLPVIDNMERAIQSIEDAKISDGYVDGVKMVISQLITVLNNEGLEEIPTENVEFDPQWHHGVAVDNIEDIEDNHIIEVYQKGYKFKEKVLRPAMVKICKK